VERLVFGHADKLAFSDNSFVAADCYNNVIHVCLMLGEWMNGVTFCAVYWFSFEN